MSQDDYTTYCGQKYEIFVTNEKLPFDPPLSVGVKGSEEYRIWEKCFRDITKNKRKPIMHYPPHRFVKKPFPEGNGMGDRIRYFQSRGYSATAYSSLRPLFFSTVRTESIQEPVV